jgi:hypothetical protein
MSLRQPSIDSATLLALSGLIGQMCGTENIDFMRCKQINSDPRTCVCLRLSSIHLRKVLLQSFLFQYTSILHNDVSSYAQNTVYSHTTTATATATATATTTTTTTTTTTSSSGIPTVLAARVLICLLFAMVIIFLSLFHRSFSLLLHVVHVHIYI